MPRDSVRLLLLVLIAALTLACAAPAPSRPTAASAPDQPQPQVSSRTVTLAHRYEPNNLAAKVQQSNTPTTIRLVNAGLTLVDDQGAIRPYLAEAAPQLNTDTWRITPDGRMETTYRLRPNL